jgi:uncharacterized protein YgiB involved in biofilm formation
MTAMPPLPCPSPLRRTLRSGRARTVLLGAAAFGALAACEDDRIDARSFSSLESCVAADGEGAPTDEECEAGFAAALATHEASAPRYESAALCQEEHGAEACVEEARPGGGSVFLPLMAGYMIGRSLSGATAMSQPVYRTAAGGAAALGGTALSSVDGRATVRPDAFRAPAVTAGQAPLTRAAVTARGGFGAVSTAPGRLTGTAGG